MPYSDLKDYYLTIAYEDVIARMEPFLKNEGYFIDPISGKINSLSSPSWSTAWHHIGDSDYYDCNLWHNIVFNAFGFIHSKCMNCFKVVVKPKNLKQLFALLDLQLDLNRPSKCGIEERSFVRSLYGGYFYNEGLQAGIECFKLVKSKISENDILKPLLDYKDANGISTRIILKRGCTEFEMKCGRSDQWKIDENQIPLEKIIDECIERPKKFVQNDMMIKHIHGRWIRFAWEHDDDTVEEFTAGIPLYSPVVTYHHMIEREM